MGLRSFARAASRLALSSIAFAVPFGVSAGPRPAAEAFAAMPTFADITLSADGSKIAFSAPRADGNLNVGIFDFTTKATEVIDLTSNKVRSLTFEDGGKLFINASYANVNDNRNKYEGGAWNVYDPAKKSLRAIEGGLVQMQAARPNEVIMATYEGGGDNQIWSLNLFQYNLETTRYVQTERGTQYTYSWLTDPTGNAIARADLNLVGKFTTLHYKNAAGQWVEGLRMTNTAIAGINFIGTSPTGRILFKRDDDNEFGRIESLSPATGAISDMVRSEDTQVDWGQTDNWSGKMVGVRIAGLEPRMQWTAPDFQEAVALVEGQMPGSKVSIIDNTPDRKIFLMSVEAPARPAKLYLLDVPNTKLTAIGSTMPSLEGVALGEQRATTFKSRDGVDIPVYITTPPGHSTTKKAPTIIFPHGGPAARDEPGFDWWAQFMASRGYVVIQPQFRGSTGFGHRHEEAGKRQWGKKMQDDVSDALAWAIKEDITDPRRACIVGASYGGYAALAGVTLTPDLYKCAVSVAGVADLPHMMAREGAGDFGLRSSSLNYWREHIGADDPTAMAAVSPARLAARVKAPILLLHGTDDTVVDIDQSRLMNTALRSTGKSVKYVELRGEDHWLSRASTRLQMLREIDTFLAEHLGPGLE
jgi:acetyl esterase/lipase